MEPMDEDIEGGNSPFSNLPNEEAAQQENCDNQDQPTIHRSTVQNIGTMTPVTSDVPAYDAFKCEGRPQLAIYHDGFAEAEKLVSFVCDSFIREYEILRSTGFEDSEIHTICYRSLRELQNPQDNYPKVGPVAFLGPAGVGKSSGLNCMLSQQAAAVENDSGRRGTHVVHEYRSARPEQLEPYLIEVRYLEPKQVQNLVKKHCYAIISYIRFNRAKESDLDEEEVKELECYYETATDFFVTLLCNQADFQTHANAKEFFNERRSEPPNEITAELVKFIHASTVKRHNEFMEVYTAHSEAELNYILQGISGPSNTAGSQRHKPSFWPIIDTVTIFQNNDLLNSGVVLADTPGVTDTNQSVVEATRSYLRRAGTILVFATPSRIVSNPELEANLRECINLGKASSTYLLVTMIDQKNVFKATEKQNLLPEDRDLLQAAEHKVQTIKAEREQAKMEKDAADDLVKYKTLDKRLAELEKAGLVASRDVKQLSVEIRNRSIQRDLKDKLREIERSRKAPDLKVFFISNVMYQKHLAGYDIKDLPTLDVEATGIPGLRRLLYDVPARGKLHVLSRICETRLPNIFRGIADVLTKSRLERKQDIEALIVRELERGGPLFEDVTTELRSCFQERIQNSIRTYEPKWREKAELMLADWMRFRCSTFNAFCKRAGRWKAPQHPRVKLDWNLEIQKIFVTKLIGAFESFEDDILRIENTAISSFRGLYATLQDELRACKDFQGIDEVPFFRFCRDVLEEFMAKTSDLFERLKKEVSEIRRCCTLESAESYTTVAMHDTYLQCLNNVSATDSVSSAFLQRHEGAKPLKQTGVHAGRVELLRRRMTGEGHAASVFTAVGQQASDAFLGVLTGWGEAYAEVMHDASAKILRDFNRRFAAPTVKTEDSQEAVRTLQRAASAALDIIDGAMKDALESCRAYEKSE